MSISAKVIADSISAEPANVQLTSVQVCLPRIILAELNAHRVFSRNYRPSRAKKMIEEVRTNQYKPIIWLKNKPGMQGGDPMSPEEIAIAEQEWMLGAAQAANLAEKLAFAGLHKQWANRCLEPYLYTHGIITSTEWSNFLAAGTGLVVGTIITALGTGTGGLGTYYFALRYHSDAQPEMRALADAIRDAIAGSTPKLLQPGEWHLPYCPDVHGKPCGMPSTFQSDDAIKVSIARCARVSYLTQDGKTPTIEDDLKLYDRLVGSVPIHASPAEHQATPDQTNFPGHRSGLWQSPHLHGNFKGWIQFRRTLPGGIV